VATSLFYARLEVARIERATSVSRNVSHLRIMSGAARQFSA
jgi:hypothetical protein